MTYGEIPYEFYERKTETTKFTDIDDNYLNEYTMDELADRSFEKPFMEHQHTGPNPHSSAFLNLRYVGSRGSQEQPNHPDLFIGHMDQDPRGSTNMPDFTRLKDHTAARTELLKVRMGENNTGHTVDSPWTNVSIDAGRQTINQRIKDNQKIFLEQRENDLQARHGMVYDAPQRRGETRQQLIDDGAHSNIADFVSSETGQINSGQRPALNDAPWRNTLRGVDVEVERYGRSTADGLVNNFSGGANRNVVASHNWATETKLQGASRQILAASMATALKYKVNPQNDASFGASQMALGVKSLMQSNDAQKATRHIINPNDAIHAAKTFTSTSRKFAAQSDDLMAAGYLVNGELEETSRQNRQAHNLAAPFEDTIGAAHNVDPDVEYGDETIMRAVRQKYATNPEEAIRYILANPTDNEYLTNLGSLIIKSLKPGSNPEQVLRKALADVTDNAYLTDRGADNSGALMPSANPENALRLGETSADHGNHHDGVNRRGKEHITDHSGMARRGLTGTDFNINHVNAITIARGLKEGSAASKREIAGSIVIDGVRPDEQASAFNSRGLVPATDVIKTGNKTSAAINAPQLAGLQTHKYSAAKMQVDNKVANSSVEKSMWRNEYEQNVSTTKAFNEFRSATQNDVDVGDPGLGRDIATKNGGVRVGPKALRPDGNEVEIRNFEF